MRDNHIHESLDLLGQIQPVEAPHFMMTRIMQKVENKKASRVSPALAWTVSLTFVVVLAINIAVLTSGTRQTRTSPEQAFAKSLHLMPNNSLYNE